MTGRLREALATLSMSAGMLQARVGAQRTLLREETSSPGSAPLAGVDRWLVLVATCSAALALLVVAGLPPEGGQVSNAVRCVVLLCFWLAGPGSAIVVRLPLTPITKIAQAPLLGLAILIAIAAASSWTGVWLPHASIAILAAGSLASSFPLMLHNLPRLDLRLQRPAPWAVVFLLTLLVCVGTWVASIPAIKDAPPSVLGLLATGPWMFPAALFGIAAVLLAALRGGSVGVAVAATGAFILALRTTHAAASSVPPYSYTYKHLGVTEQLIQDHHVLAGTTDIYMNWPGMFAAAAYLSDASGVAVLDMAAWISPVVHLLIALQVAALARVLGARPIGAAAAAALIVLLNWVGQDYFAPQSVAMCLASGIIVLLAQSSGSRTCAVLALALYAPVMATHQLTPFWLLALTLALLVLRCVPWWLPLGMVLVVLIYMAPRLDVVETYGLFSGFDPLGNARSNVPPVPALGRDIGGLFAKGTAGLMWASVLAVLLNRAWRIGFRRAWRDKNLLMPAAITFSSFLLLGSQDYGGEAVLRVTLYSTIGSAAILGPVLADALQGRLRRPPSHSAVRKRRPVQVVIGAMWLLVVTAASAGSTFNQWSWNILGEEEVAAARWLAGHTNATVIPLTLNWPGRAWADYEEFIKPRSREEEALNLILAEMLPADPYATASPIPLRPTQVVDAVRRNAAAPTFVVFSNSMRQFDAYYSIYEPGSYQDTLDSLAMSPEWELVWQEGDVWVFQYTAPDWPVG